MLMWRSFLHWLGGMGVIVFLGDYSKARRSAEHPPYEGRKPRPDCGQGVASYEKLCGAVVWYLLWTDGA